jgi:EAL and modified HD-GYP domain-containing signal transduction protein
MDNQHQEFFLGCQPILDRRQSICAYELLFRSSQSNAADILDDLQASASVISYAFGDLWIGSSLGKGKCFINVSKKLLMSSMVELMPSDRVVLELLETIEPEDAVLERCRELKGKGFLLALDDFECDNELEKEKLMDLVEIVKVDLTRVPPEKLEEFARCLKRWPVSLLAEKVETTEQVKQCLDLGFSYFQGYYFARPHMIIGKRVDPSHITLLHLLGMILEDADVHEIEKLFKRAPDLSYNLLRLVNSVASGMHQKISTLKQAIVVLGQQQLLRWLQLLLFTERGGENISSPLLLLAAQRGKLLELLAARINPHNQEFHEQAFMTGILSLLDALLNQPLDEVIKQINLTSDVREALLEREGKLGNMLQLAEELERNDYEKVAERIFQLGLSISELMQIRTEAMAWASGIAEGENA